MKEQSKIVFFLTVILLILGACAPKLTIPVTYQPQNFTRLKGNVSIGEFNYEPAQENKLTPNQLSYNKAAKIYISTDIAEFVRRATALESERTGLVLGQDNPLEFSGNILEFSLKAKGTRSIDWKYSVKYIIMNKTNNRELHSEVYNISKNTGAFNQIDDIQPTLNAMVLMGYEKFIQDKEVQAILK